MNGIISVIGSLIFVLFLASIIIGWIVIIIHKIVCGRKKECKNDNCKFKLYCSHAEIRQKEQLRLRKEMLEKRIEQQKRDKQ